MYKFLTFFLFFSLCSINAQIHEVGVFLGGANYIGDVGSTSYISPNKPAFGLLYKWNKSPRLSYRFALNWGLLSADDKDSDEAARNLRDYNFLNSSKEVSLGIEFNFFDFDLDDGQTKFTPYVFSGLNIFRYRDAYLVNNSTGGGSIVSPSESTNAFAIPITLGIKTNISRHFIVALEVGARYTFTDNLDGSNPKDQSLPKFGNLNNNDWYVFSGLTLSYTFGRKPCYCPQ